MQSVFSIILLAVGVASFHHSVGVDYQGVMSQDDASLSKAEVERSATESSDDLVEDQQTNIAGLLSKPTPMWISLGWLRPKPSPVEVKALVDEIMTKIQHDQCWDLLVAKDVPFLNGRGAVMENPIQFKKGGGKNQFRQLTRWIHADKLPATGVPNDSTLGKAAADAYRVLKNVNYCFSKQTVQLTFKGFKVENLCLCFTPEGATERAAENRAKKIAAAEKAAREAAKALQLQKRLEKGAARSKEAERKEQIDNGKVCCCRMEETRDACSKLDSKWFATRRFFAEAERTEKEHLDLYGIPQPAKEHGNRCCKLTNPKWNALDVTHDSDPCSERKKSKTFVWDGCSAADKDSDIAEDPAGAAGTKGPEGSAGSESPAGLDID